jgi:DNA-binding beta-propeller fold protein YncE
MTSHPRPLLRVAVASLALGSAACTNSGEGDPCDEPGVICTWAGTGKLGFNGDDKPLAESNLYWPVDLTIDEDLGTYVLDWNNHAVRRVTDEGTFETVIGTYFPADGPPDMSDLEPPGAPGTEVDLNHPTQLVPLPDDTLVLVAWHNHKLRRYDPDTGLVTVTCGGPAGFAGDGGPARMARLNQPSALVVAENGTQYILDQRNQVIRSIDPDGIMTTLAGTPMMAGFEGDGGPASAAKFSWPPGSNPPPGGGLALDGDTLYVSDTLNHRIRAIDLESGEITTIAGTGEAGFSGDGDPAIEAELDFPRKLTIGPDGRLYVGDQRNHRIRAIDLESGIIDTVAGNGEQGFTGDGVLATETALDQPTGVTFDEEGAMYVLDTFNSRIRRVVLEEGKGGER